EASMSCGCNTGTGTSWDDWIISQPIDPLMLIASASLAGATPTYANSSTFAIPIGGWITTNNITVNSTPACAALQSDNQQMVADAAQWNFQHLTRNTLGTLVPQLSRVMFMRGGTRPIETWRAFASEAPGWYVWALLTPLIAFLAERFPLGRPVKWRSIVAHVLGWLFVATSAAATWAGASLWLRGARGSFLTVLRSWFLSGLPFTVLGYAAVLGVCYMIASRELARERERQAAHLAQQLSEAQLATLRAQLQPHFLFNSLNAIMALVRDADNARAVAALTTLSAILRAALQLGSAAEVALSREVAFTRDYLDLERLRFPDRLRVTFDIPPALLDARVPTFVLQPFVENAIKHGLMDSRHGIAIAVSADSHDGALTLIIRDDGVGFRNSTSVNAAIGNSSSASNGHSLEDANGGVGIANVRQRLASMYGDDASLIVSAGDHGGGALVTLRIPLARMLAA
ncbi:MAG: histidine kinase, partial [Gemmatimonadaceae bacterium]